MKTLLLTAAACAMLSALSSDAFAGGDNGGSKDTARIRVRNNTNEVVAVIVDVDEDDEPDSQDEFEDAGGRFLQPGRSTTFKVSKGEHTVTAVLVDDEGFELGDFDQVDVDAEDTVRLVVTTDDNDNAIIDEL